MHNSIIYSLNKIIKIVYNIKAKYKDNKRLKYDL